MKYKGHDIEVVEWPYGKPWPMSISYDRIRMEYASIWTNRAAHQIIFYREHGTVRLHEVARSVFSERK